MPLSTNYAGAINPQNAVEPTEVSVFEDRALYYYKTVRFENGAYVFLNTVPSTILSVVMEPDFNSVSKRKMSLFSMKLVDFDENGSLPIYRYCHDLSDGKISVAT